MLTMRLFSLAFFLLSFACRQCFSQPQFDNEGCAGWVAAAGAKTSFPDTGASTYTLSFDIDRGKSPTFGCPQVVHAVLLRSMPQACHNCCLSPATSCAFHRLKNFKPFLKFFFIIIILLLNKCSTYGTFHYDIRSPPQCHPVYRSPLPGIGWQNTSYFTFWGSLFDRTQTFAYDSKSFTNKTWVGGYGH